MNTFLLGVGRTILPFLRYKGQNHCWWPLDSKPNKYKDDILKPRTLTFCLICVDKNNLELDVDIAGDLATLKENLAKFKKGKMKGLEDIDINELDWVYF